MASPIKNIPVSLYPSLWGPSLRFHSPPFPFYYLTFHTRLPTPPSRALEISFDGSGGEKKRTSFVFRRSRSINQKQSLSISVYFETAQRIADTAAYLPTLVARAQRLFLRLGFEEDAYRVGMMRARARHGATMQHCRFSVPQPMPSYLTLWYPHGHKRFLGHPLPPFAPLPRSLPRGLPRGKYVFVLRFCYEIGRESVLKERAQKELVGIQQGEPHGKTFID